MHPKAGNFQKIVYYLFIYFYLQIIYTILLLESEILILITIAFNQQK